MSYDTLIRGVLTVALYATTILVLLIVKAIREIVRE